VIPGPLTFFCHNRPAYLCGECAAHADSGHVGAVGPAYLREFECAPPLPRHCPDAYVMLGVGWPFWLSRSLGAATQPIKTACRSRDCPAPFGVSRSERRPPPHSGFRCSWANPALHGPGTAFKLAIRQKGCPAQAQHFSEIARSQRHYGWLLQLPCSTACPATRAWRISCRGHGACCCVHRRASGISCLAQASKNWIDPGHSGRRRTRSSRQRDEERSRSSCSAKGGQSARFARSRPALQSIA